MNKKIEFALHLMAWVIIFLTPMMMSGRAGDFNITRYLFFSVAQTTLVIVFYVNYFVLVPKYYFGGKRSLFFVYNVAIILTLSFAIQLWITHCMSFFGIAHGNPPKTHDRPSSLVFIVKDVINLVMSAVMSTAICLGKQLHKAEDERKEAEQAKTVAELKNLRAQINPHFLLNTLNNIYALTAIDASRAQKAIDELSRILRHVLYDNERPFISLTEEVKFLDDYVSLMRIRLAKNVRVSFTTDISPNSQANIAPMIFISLVENAFKHGVSTTEPSFILIHIEADNKHIACTIRNSNYPKPKSDNSGHGIGLRQVKRRLELIYPGKYEWKRETTNNEYLSTIIIHDTKLCNN